MSPGTRQLIFFLVLLSLPVSSYFLVFKPQNTEIEKARKEIAQKEAMLDKLRQATAQTADLERANTEIAGAIDNIRARLPSGKEMDDVLRDVAALAAQEGLKIPNFKKAEKAMPAGMAMEQPIDIEITGDFDGFYKFLLALEQLPRITRIPDLSIIRSDKVDGEMKTKLVLSIYYEGEGSTGK